ncbi:MAG TPA: DEAD/DEAH box helicase, partial [Acidimicrobiales bacterium]|nr:DEAD/DEAH box helicase [Acidimicrobiales bacterium]
MTSTFAALGAPAPIVDRLDARGITDAFPIQTATLPDALAGRDVCGKAPTGSGKTIAFAIPLAARVSNSAPKKPKGLVLVPTRELASQVAAELKALGVKRTLAVFGGVGYRPQIDALRRGVDVLVACPGRLADLVNEQHVDLSAVELAVLDEADRMADMGFLPEVKRLLDRVRPDRQTLLFSATLDGDVDVLIQRYQRNPVTHELHVEEDAPKNRHLFWKLAREERIDVTADLVNKQWPAIVFCRTKHGADRLAKQLVKRGVDAAAIHGDRSQGQRERALASFTSGKVQALIATDVAARGIHVDDVALVVHFDQPGSEKDYVHRSGRTGRAGATGLVVSLVQKDLTDAAFDLQRKLGYEQELHWPDMDALVDDRHDAREAVAPARAARPTPSGNRRPPQRSRR